MIKVLVEGVDWVSRVIVLDWYTKAVVGCHDGLQCTAKQWLEVLDTAVIAGSLTVPVAKACR